MTDESTGCACGATGDFKKVSTGKVKKPATGTKTDTLKKPEVKDGGDRQMELKK